MENKVPKLRFPEFEGEWEEKKLGEISEISSGGTPSRTNPSYWNGSINWVSTTLIDFNKITETDEKITEEGLKNSSAKIFPKGTLLMAMYGQGKTRGKISILGIDAATNQACGAIMPNKAILNNIFLFQNLAKRYDEIRDLSNQGGQENLSGGIIKGIEVSFPSLPEQTKIANFLTAVDDKLSSLKKKKQLLEQYKKGVMQQIFSQQLRFKDDNGEDFAEWEEKKFSEYIKLYRGSSPRPIVRFITESADGINWIKIGDTKNVEDYIIKTVSEKITIAGSLQSRKVEVGELILANSMSFGKTYKLNISGCIYDGWFVLREYEKFFDKSFLMQLLNSEFMQKQYKTLSTGGVVQNISSDIVYSTNLLKPSLPEQTKIANFLSAIDEKISHCGVQIEKMEGWKKGLLQQMFV
jgi:type I restriction enzyme S subunit